MHHSTLQHILTWHRLAELIVADSTAAVGGVTSTEDWDRASELWGIPVAELKRNLGDAVLALPEQLGFSPKFYTSVLPLLQVAKLLWLLLHRDRLSALFCDQHHHHRMIATIMATLANLGLVMRTHGVHPLQAENPYWQDFQKFSSFGDCQPKIGAAVFVVSPARLEHFVREWDRIMTGSRLIQMSGVWRPRLVILHGVRGEQLAEQYGGERSGLHHKLSDSDWELLRVSPSWDKSRQLYTTDLELKWDLRGDDIERGDWCDDDETLADEPPPWSTSLMVVTTRESWETQFIPPMFPTDTGFARASRANPDDPIFEEDDTNRKTARMVSNCATGGFLWLDDIENEKCWSSSTPNYTAIISNFTQTIRERVWPSICGTTAIPFSASVDGMRLVPIFAKKAMSRPSWERSDEPLHKIVSELDLKEALEIWRAIRRGVEQLGIPGAEVVDMMLEQSPGGRRITQTVADIVRHTCVGWL